MTDGERTQVGTVGQGRKQAEKPAKLIKNERSFFIDQRAECSLF